MAMLMTKLWRPTLAAALAPFCLTGCGLVGQTEPVHGNVPDSVTVTSPAFREDGHIPVRFACRGDGGKGTTPPLRWSVAAGNVGAYALVVDDTDAPGAYVHWVLFNIDPTATEILEGAIPEHAEQAKNTAGTVGYTPPCPPGNERHHYRFTLYALREALPLHDGADLKEVLAQIAQRTVARGRLTVRFGAK